MTHVMMTGPTDMPRLFPAQMGASYSAPWMMPGPSMDVNDEVLGKTLWPGNGDGLDPSLGAYPLVERSENAAEWQ